MDLQDQGWLGGFQNISGNSLGTMPFNWTSLIYGSTSTFTHRLDEKVLTRLGMVGIGAQASLSGAIRSLLAVTAESWGGAH